MKTNRQVSQRSGFTLIEMVGVLAVIAILAALLVPKIFQAISDSRLSSSAESINGIKTACMDYFGKYGSFATNDNFQTSLLASNIIDKPFATKIGVTNTVQVKVGKGGVAAAGYKLDGTTVATTTSSIVVEAVLTGVDAADAWELSKRLDGEPSASPSLTPTASGTADDLGRVNYATPDPATGKTTVYVYLAHK